MLKLFLLSPIVLLQQGSGPCFNDAERQAIVRLWSNPSTYSISEPDNAKDGGKYAVRLTPEGSLWLWNYNKARGLGKTPPGQTPPVVGEEQKLWDAWVDNRIAYDRWRAAKQAMDANVEEFGVSLAQPESETCPVFETVPQGLLSLVGEPPTFANVVTPKKHSIHFGDLNLTYNDNPNMRPRFAYYRYAQGVQSFGVMVRSIPKEDMDKLFAAAGVSEFEQKVMRAVSMLEGGFDSVNTYDTGYVSFGLIQFACLRSGAGSLGTMLQLFKKDYPEAFDRHFRKYGVDVCSDGRLAVVDLKEGYERQGPDAAQAIINDPRLIAVFQRAGLLSKECKVSQIKAAKVGFYPANDVLNVTIGETVFPVRVGDVVKSEAGMATLMDRKVNTGKIDLLSQVLMKLAVEKGITDPTGFVAYERDIVSAMRYRKDYLALADLGQPLDSDRANSTSSRKAPNTRTGKTKTNTKSKSGSKKK